MTDGRAAGVAQHIEVALNIRITIRVVFTEPVIGKPGLCCVVQGSCEPVCRGLSLGGVAAPSAGVHPFPAISCGIDMKGDENHLVNPGFVTNPVDAGAAIGEGNVLMCLAGFSQKVGTM